MKRGITMKIQARSVSALCFVAAALVNRGHCVGATCSRLMSRMHSSTSFGLHQRQIPSGLCAVYKPKGCTSREVVDQIKLLLDDGMNHGRKRNAGAKVGHGGTLDPMAEGVMVLGIGAGTKLLPKYLSGTKGYSAVAKVGISTDTLDITGTIVETKDCSFVTVELLQATLPKFRGDILQTPPMYSAIRSNGKRLYDLARSGVEVEREARPVTVDRLLLTSNHQLPFFGLDIECGGGTYVRSLIDDICRDVGAVGCMTELVRTKQAVFTVQDCLHPEEWTLDHVARHILKCNALVGISARELV